MSLCFVICTAHQSQGFRHLTWHYLASVTGVSASYLALFGIDHRGFGILPGIIWHPSPGFRHLTWHYLASIAWVSASYFALFGIHHLGFGILLGIIWHLAPGIGMGLIRPN